MYIYSTLMYMLGTLKADHWRLGTGTLNCHIRRCEDTGQSEDPMWFAQSSCRTNSGLRRICGSSIRTNLVHNLQIDCRCGNFFPSWSRGSPAGLFASLCTKPALPAL